MPVSYPQLELRRNSERLLLQGHPWVYSGAVDGCDPSVSPGDIVDVVNGKGRFIGRGYYNPRSTIVVRILTRQENAAIDGEFLQRQIARAVALRRGNPLLAGTNACRLVHGENDGLPGLIVDEYAGFLVVQLHTLGMDRLRQDLVEALEHVVHPRGIYERSDVGTRRADGLNDRPCGTLLGEEPPELIDIEENGVVLHIDVRRGQKTGLFLDQRPNRTLLQQMSEGKSVLDCFSYTGGFAAHALKGGARRCLSIDIARAALIDSRRNLESNCPSGSVYHGVTADLFSFLDDMANRGPQFDIVVIDPPSLLRKQKDLNHAMGIYTKLNRNALKLVRNDGILVTASCSTRISNEDFFQILRRASAGARVNTRLIAFNQNAPDHPVNPAFPEGRYLKCIFAAVDR